MAICTNCTRWIEYLYTIYESAYNLRLEQCSHCGGFADPYVEYDSLTLLIDLILLKRGVYRHLFYNREVEPRRAGKIKSSEASERERELSRLWLIVRLGTALVVVDAFIRASHLHDRTSTTIVVFLRTFLGCLAETLAFHSGILVACYLTLDLLPPKRQSDIHKEFRLSLVSLSLLYSSLTKLFLLFLLSIWKPSTTTSNNSVWDTLDREWVVRNVLGGMSAGFGLRVILPSSPFLTTLIILAGWAAKTAVAGLVSEWVGLGSEWVAYSIP